MRNYSKAARERIASDMTADAARHDETAARLEAKGKPVAAGIQRRGAEERREIAAAARTSSEALNDVLNPL